jgi:transposase
MHDNATAHKSEEANEYLEKNGLKLIDWPSQSPDLNPIENVWAILKNEIWKIKDKIHTKDDLKKAIEYIFYTYDSI